MKKSHLHDGIGIDVTKWKSEKVQEISSALRLSMECLVTVLPVQGWQHHRDQQEEALVCKVQPGMTALNQHSEKHWCVNQRETIHLWGSCLVSDAFDFEMRKLTPCGALSVKCGKPRASESPGPANTWISSFHTRISSSFNSFTCLPRYTFITVPVPAPINPNAHTHTTITTPTIACTVNGNQMCQ